MKISLMYMELPELTRAAIDTIVKDKEQTNCYEQYKSALFLPWILAVWKANETRSYLIKDIYLLIEKYGLLNDAINAELTIIANTKDDELGYDDSDIHSLYNYAIRTKMMKKVISRNLGEECDADDSEPILAAIDGPYEEG